MTTVHDAMPATVQTVLGERGPMSSLYLQLLIGGALLCGLVSAWIATRKGRSGVGFFVLGVVIGIFGVLIAACVGRRQDLTGFAALSPYRPARAHPGWYQDPQQAHVLRWHDGVNWTQEAHDTRPAPETTGRRTRHRG